MLALEDQPAQERASGVADDKESADGVLVQASAMGVGEEET